MGRLTSLHVKNYKCFKDLELPMVGNVNLIAGKNNVGKTTLLEAVALVSSGANPKELFRIMDRRERISSEAELYRCFLDYFENRVSSINWSGETTKEIQIAFPGVPVAPEFAYLTIERRKDPGSKVAPTFSIWAGDRFGAFDVSLDTRQAAYAGVFDADEKIAETSNLFRSNLEIEDKPGLLRTLWDETVARPEEDLLVEALRLIEPSVERIVMPTAPERPIPKVRLGNGRDLQSITRFGDGMTKLFQIAILLANAKGGILLLDEIENGLHHSIFPALWRFVFEAAKKLNVTVFATTHSHDAVAAFSRVARQDEQSLGVLTRLDRRKRGIVAVQFTEEQAAIAMEEGMEVR